MHGVPRLVAFRFALGLVGEVLLFDYLVKIIDALRFIVDGPQVLDFFGRKREVNAKTSHSGLNRLRKWLPGARLGPFGFMQEGKGTQLVSAFRARSADCECVACSALRILFPATAWLQRLA